MKTKIKIILILFIPMIAISQSDSMDFVKDSMQLYIRSEGQKVNIEKSNKTIQKNDNELSNSKLYKEMYDDSKSTNKWLIGIFLTFLGLLSAFFIYTLKQQDKRIERLQDSKITDRENEIQTDHETKDKTIREKEIDDQLSKPEGKESDITDKSELEPNKYTAIDLIYQNKIEDANDEFSKYLQGKTDDEKVIETINFEYYKFLNGDTNSNNVIDKLIESTNNPKIKSKGNILLANAYYTFGSIEKAKERAEIVIQLAQDDFLVEANILLSKTLLKKNHNDAAEKLLNLKVQNSNNDSIKFDYLMALNDLLVDQSKDNERIEVLENALLLRPNDTDVIFKLAYNYSELGFKKLSLNCYQKLLSISNNGAANNNISILYENFDLDIYRVAHLKEGMNLKESYAGPNLASHFLQNGFIEKAREIINKEEEVGNNSERFLFVKSEIDHVESNQKELKKKIESKGREMRNFFKAYSAKSREKLSVETGKYKLNNIYVEVKINDGELSITWRFDENNDFEISGLLNGNALQGTYKRPYKSSSDFGTMKTEHVFFNNYKSYLYHDSNKIFVMVIEKDEILNNLVLHKE